ncbi:hypothetical protein J1N35_034982 [Gossypium stocksii]|uniref:Reverse transcriptase domain-containing protein n=1 Tax=Gossypium stocksii TaxID=47602 RepID=A0A9D3ZR21_9ROSI|nr:hypothetical protein J1N35_034982 [Gossypium stocksii]
MAKEINAMLERLKFSKEESIRVMSTNTENNFQGFETWAIGKIIAEEKPNREAMYRVLRSLWFTKEAVHFVALNEEVTLVKFGCLEDRNKILNLMPWLFDNCLFTIMPFIKGKELDNYAFNFSPFWLRVFNILLEYIDRQTTLDIKNAIGELVAIDWKDRNGGWTTFLSWLKANTVFQNQDRSIWKNGIKIVATNGFPNKANDESKTDTKDESEQILQKGKGKIGEENLTSNSPMEIKAHKLASGGLGWMDGCLTVSAIGKSGGLAMLWKKGTRVEITNYSKNHIDSLIHFDNDNTIRFIGFYENVDQNNKKSSWELLRRIGRIVKETWIIRGISTLFLMIRRRREANSDHDAIVRDTEGRKLKGKLRDPRLMFRYDPCWSKENEAKIIIKMFGVMALKILWKGLKREMNDKLLKEFKDEEIIRSFNQIDQRKAPGIDGLSGSFYKEHWDIVGADILKLCHEILRRDRNVESLNETIIVLIPKIKNPRDMTNFCPITLCRVVYKIVAKVLANRLKDTISKSISQNQSTFVPGWMIHDNILISHELAHYLQSAKYGPNKGFAIKLDLSKAYDRVEWKFINVVMKKIGYAEAWVNKVMSYICTV